MKTQFSFTKSGFTMVEIMVVIVIIASLFVTLSRVTFKPQENIVKAERLASKIQSILHSSNVSLMLWRMDSNNIATTWATINIYASWVSLSGNTISWQLAPTLSGKLQPPFFNDNDSFYQIESIKGCIGWWSTSSWVTSSVQISMSKNSISFSGASPFPSGSNIIEINVRYINMAKKIIFDRRTGRTEIRRAWEDLCK